MQVALDELLDELKEHVEDELSEMPPVDDRGTSLDVEDLAVEGRTWTKLDQVVAVVADLKGSTKLGVRKHAASTASIYEAGVHSLVQVLDDFGADDLAIQGDGAVGVFWGNKDLERAIAAGITIKTFSERYLETEVAEKWPDAPRTGFKVGVAASPILVKRIGLRREERFEEVWAGKAVNYATKAAQTADRGELVVSGFVWDVLEANDYIAYTCGCGGGPSASLWEDVAIKGLPEGEPDQFGKKLTSQWCLVHGEEFCNAILDGETRRPDVAVVRGAHSRKMAEHPVLLKAREDRKRRRALGRLR